MLSASAWDEPGSAVAAGVVAGHFVKPEGGLVKGGQLSCIRGADGDMTNTRSHGLPFPRQLAVSRRNCAIYLSDGYINVALLPSRHDADYQGIEHIGFSVADAGEIADTAKEHGAAQGLEARPRDGRFAESRIYDPIGIPIDLSTQGRATEPGAGLRTPAQNA